MMKKLLKQATKNYLQTMVADNHEKNIKDVLDAGVMDDLLKTIDTLSRDGFTSICLFVSVPHNDYLKYATFNTLRYNGNKNEGNTFRIEVKNKEIANALCDVIKEFYETAYDVKRNEYSYGITSDSYYMTISWKSLLN